MNRRPLTIGASALVLLLLALAAIVMRGAHGAKPALQQPAAEGDAPGSSTTLSEPQWAEGKRITVEVLNATKVRGLARRASRTLRDRGFDVVSTGTNREQFDSTQVLDRTGHRDWAALAAKAMGGGTVLVRPDSSREVDLTVLIGTAWHPPSQPFYP